MVGVSSITLAEPPSGKSSVHKYPSLQQEGVIGVTDETPLDNPVDNIFHINLDNALCEGDIVWLVYELDGVQDHTNVSRSINDQLSVGGYIVKKRKGWSEQREQVSVQWLREGDNAVRFTMPATATHSYRVRNLRLEVVRASNENEIPELVFNRPSQVHYQSQAYVKGFVGNTVTALRINAENVKLYNQEFESLIDVESIKSSCAVEVELTHTDGTTSCHRVEFTGREDADFIFTRNGIHYRTERFVDNKTESTIALQGAMLKTAADILSAPAHLSITTLRDVDIPALDAGMENVTAHHEAFRFLPNGTVFTKEVKLSIPYDSTKIPDGYTTEDIRTYYFDEQAHHWVAVPTDTVLAGVVVSNTTHFTDYINAIIKVPESPEVEAYNSTSMKGIRAANPTAAVNLIDPPSANNTGSAAISYPINIPAGRNGMQPQLAVSYNSAGGNGWMGLGWNLMVPSIGIDTRWGVPRYDADFETETYSMNGEMLTPVAHRGDLQRRYTSGKQFFPRTEGAFNRIQRFGSTPSEYYWVVTDKSGTKYYYGATGGGNGTLDNQSLLRTGANNTSGSIAQWMLSEVRDLNGNTTRYYYAPEIGTGLANGKVNGHQLYLSKITYTGMNGADGKYSVIFTRVKRDPVLHPDVTIAANLGFKQVTAHLLKNIQVFYNGSTKVRSYEFTYKLGAFQKTLLQNIREFDSQDNFFTQHDFTYYDEVTSGTGYKPFRESRTWAIDENDGEVRGDFKKRIEGRFDDNASMLSGSKSTDNSFGMAVSVGFNLRVTDKTLSVGGSFSSSGSETQSTLTMIDLNGDGLPDKVFIKQGQLHFSPNLSGPAGAEKFGVASPVLRGVSKGTDPVTVFFREKSKTISGGLEAQGPASAPVFGGFGLNKTKSEQTIYFSEVNGDQLPDLVDRGKVYFGRLNPQTGVPEFVESSALTASPIVQGGAISTEMGSTDELELQRTLRENPLHDVVRMWEAPYTGRIKITAPVQLLNIQDEDRAETAADGVRVAIQLRNTEVWKLVIPADDYSLHTPAGVNDLSVNKGDRVFFRVGSISNGSYDQVSWAPIVEYTTLPFDLKTDVNRKSYKKYDAQKDFKLSALQKVSMPEKGRIRIESRFLKPVTTDNLQLEIIREITNPQDTNDPDRVISTDTILVRKYSWREEAEKDSVIELDVQEGHHLQFKVHSNTNISWADVDWKVRLYYTSLTDPKYKDQEIYDLDGNPVIEFKPIVGYSMYNTEVKMSKPFVIAEEEDSVDIEVMPVLELSGAPVLFDGKIYFSVKKKDALLAKDTIEVEGNQVVSDLEAKELRVANKDSIYVEYHVERVLPRGATAGSEGPGLADLILVSGATITTPSDEEDVEAGLHIDDGGNREFGHGYHRWGHFAYQANDELRANSPIVESELRVSDNVKKAKKQDPGSFEDGNDLKDSDSYKPYDEKFIILVPMSKGQNWTGYDNDTYVDATGISSSRMGDNDPKASATTTVSAGTGARAISRKTESTGSSYSLGVSAGIAGVSATYNEGITKAITDYTDFNGDRYPDIVVGNNVQFTNAQGGLSDRKYTHPDQNNSVSTSDAKGLGFSGSFTTSKEEHGISKKVGKAIVSMGDGKGSAGLSANGSIGHNNTSFVWMDINGDGLPDRVSPSGVRLNLGYSFTQEEEPWDQQQLAVQKGESTNTGAGLGISLWGGSISGGISLARSDNKTVAALQDVNGDGLVDIVSYQGGSSAIKVRLNTGNSFAAAKDWTGALHISESSSTSQSANIAFTAGIYIPGANIKITVNPSSSKGFGASRELAKLADMDGDGFPDYVTSNRYDDLHVSRSTIGRTNMLMGVKRPLGASFEMNYARVGNTYDLPQSQWVMNSVLLRDGFKNDGIDSMLTTFTYDSGYYDRHERESYGFKKVITRTHNTGDKNLPVYTQVTQVFENRDYFKKGALLNEVMTDKDGKKYVEKTNEYELQTVSDEVKFLALKKTEQRFFEGQSEAGKSTSNTFVYDALGNVTAYTDDGDPESTEDDLTATITYHDLDGLYVKGTPKSIKVNGGLRRRESVIDPNTGDIKQIKQYLSESEIAIHDLEYDTYGNLKKITRPKNAKDQRLSFEYEYDADVNTYTTKVKNSYGYSSEATYDVRFGQVLSTKDLNGNETSYEIDNLGRVISVTGPYEKGSAKTIQFEYHPEASLPFAITKHYDPANPKNTLNTVILVDGLGRVLQTKKDIALYDGEGKPDKEMMSVSGRVFFDAFGRTTTAYYPTTTTVATDVTVLGTFLDTKDGIDPTTTTYDVMNRALTVTLPDKAVTKTEYGFGQDRNGQQQFSTKTTDANGKQTEQFTDVRGRVTAVKNYTSEKDIWTSFKYNAINEQIEATDDLGHTTFSQYDNFGRRTQRKHPDAGTTAYSYDLAGNLKELVTANLAKEGQAIKYTYDLERLTDITYPQNPENNVKYTYGAAGASDNRAGRIVLQEDASGAQEFFYGPLGEVVKNVRTIVIPQHDEQTYTTEWKYDTWNRLTSMIYADGEEVTYTYNVGGLLRSMDGKKKNATFSYVKQLGYDKFEQRVFLAYGNGTKTTYAYEPERRRLQNMTAQTAARRSFMDNVYTYDKVNNILGMVNKAPVPGASLMGGSSEYTYNYDDLYRLTTAQGHYKGANEEHNYTLAMAYNSVGGITQKTQRHLKKGNEQKKTSYSMAYTYGEEQPHAPTHIGDQTYTYDANGNQSGWTSDKSGQRRNMMWDEENRLRSVQDNGAVYQYIYDASGERVIKGKNIGQRVFVNGEIKASSGGMGNYQIYVNPYIVLRSGGYTKHYYIEGQRIVSKLGGGWDNNGKGPLKAGDGKVNYPKKTQDLVDAIVKNLKFLGADGQVLTAGKSGKVPPGQLKGGTSTAESFRYFYHPDHLGSTSYVTDATGEVYQHVEYFAFGETFVEEHSNTDRTPYLYNGKELDEETGLYYYGARYYDARTSIFLSVDPMAEKMSNVSSYAYCFNNPVRFTDPQGLEPDDRPSPNIWQRVKAFFGIGRIMGTRVANNQRYVNHGNLRGKGKHNSPTAQPQQDPISGPPSSSPIPDPQPETQQTPDPVPDTPQPQVPQDTPEPPPGNPVTPPLPCVPQKFDLSFNWIPNQSSPEDKSFALGQLQTIADQWNGCNNYSQVSITVNTPLSVTTQNRINTKAGITNNTLMYNRAQWIQRQLNGMGIGAGAFLNNKGQRRLFINWGIPKGTTPSSTVSIK